MVWVYVVQLMASDILVCEFDVIYVSYLFSEMESPIKTTSN